MAARRCIRRNKRKWLPGAFFLFWSVAMAGNREYIGEWAANISLLDIAGLLNPEFLEGSVLTVRLFLTAGILASVGLAAYMATQFVGGAVVLPRRVRQGLALLPLLIFIWPASPPQLWIQQNIVEENLHQFVQMLTPDRSNLSPGWVLEARRLLIASQKPDLQGELFVTPQPDANVIIINIESLSDNILQRGWMPYLKKLADNNLYYSYYILPNLTTIRGLYAQFCGESTYWGRFGRDNMVRHIRDARVRCLPDILTEQGYHTVYLQGAGLNFQNKANIIPATGFMEVLGRGEMPGGDRYSDWGLDDNSLFINALHKIEEIESYHSGMPWMLSLMTVSTHHPYGVDPSFKPNFPLRQRAFLYADQSLRVFLETLQQTGRLNNTLVIISGDESRESRKSLSGLGSTIVRNQGLLVVVTPSREKKRVAQPFMQSDILLSVLDYTVMDIPPEVGGRSIFREYRTHRPIAFANYSQQSIFAFWQAGELTQCRTDKWKCDKYLIGDKTLFDPDLKFAPERAVSGPMRALFQENENYWLGK